MTKLMSLIRFVVTHVLVPLMVLFVGLIVFTSLAMALNAIHVLAGFYYAVALVSRTTGVSVISANLVVIVVIYIIGLPVVLLWERRRAAR